MEVNIKNLKNEIMCKSYLKSKVLKYVHQNIKTPGFSDQIF
jgi:hypothetical protein